MILRSDAGIALIMVLFAVSLMAAVTVHFGTTVNWQLQAAVNQADSVRLGTILKSVFNIFRAAVHSDGINNTFDSHYDIWAKLDNAALAELTGSEELSVVITDLSGLLQVNGLVSEEENQEKRNMIEQQQRVMWLRFLLSGKFAVKSEEEALELIDSISDWIDKDDEERENGAENNFYQALKNPYRCGNNYFTYSEELLLVRGMTVDILYGTEEHAGILQYITVYNKDGKINLNTAPLEVIRCLADDISEEIAQELIDFRDEKANQESLEQADWYKQVTGFPDDIVFNDAMLTQLSQYFSLTVEAIYNGFPARGTGVLHRTIKNEQSLVYWKLE
jgi:general secretion pathway protein K